MTWQTILAMLVIIPVILLPVAIVWYLNSGRIYSAIKEIRARRAARLREKREPSGVRETEVINDSTFRTIPLMQPV